MYRVHRSDLQLIWCQYDKWEMQVKINNQHKDICLHKSMEIMRREERGIPDDNYEAGSLTYINMSSDDAQHMTVRRWTPGHLILLLRFSGPRMPQVTTEICQNPDICQNN